MDEPSKLILSPKKNGNGCIKLFSQFKDIVSEKLKSDNPRVAVFTHPSPDPDAIASQMGLQWLLKKIYDVDVDMYISGKVSHPQNLRMETLLSPKLIPIEEYKEENYCLNIVVDTLLSNIGRKDIQADVVIDHHLEIPVNEFNGLFINLHTGSCCGTIYQLIKYYGAIFEEDVDHDNQVATALMVGIYTDTCGMLGDRFTEYDHEAYGSLFPYRDSEALKKIARFQRPRKWVSIKAAAANEATIVDTVAAVGLGMLSPQHRDLIADMADEMLTWEGVDLSIAFAVIDGGTLQGSVRSTSPGVSAAKLCKELGNERDGDGWGHAAMGGYQFGLGGFSLRSDDTDETREETWKLLCKREIGRLFKILKK